MSLFQMVNNDLATIAISAMCGVFLSDNSYSDANAHK